MKKTTQKNLKYLVSIGGAKCANDMDCITCPPLHPIERLAVSRGIYGANGLLFRGADGELYAVTARNSALFYFL